MTISNEDCRITQVGNGSTDTIAVPWPIHSTDDLDVVSVVTATGEETSLAITSGWTWSGTEDDRGHYPNGGTITIVDGAWASTITMVVFREPSFVQELDLVEDDSLPVEEVEAALDYQTFLAQRANDRINRSLRAPDWDVDEMDDLPMAVDRASKYLGFDSDGQPTVLGAPTDTSITTAFTETLLDDPDGDTFVNTLVGAGLSDHGAALASGDQIPYRDVDQDTGGRTTVVEILGQGTNALTEDTTPDPAADFLMTYDASASTAKKVKPENVGAKKIGTLQASTSGVAIDFTSIPADVKRITIMFSGVSTNGTSKPLIQIGDVGGIEPTGYLGSSTALDDGSAVAVSNFTTGFGINSAAAANILHGAIVLTLMNAATFLWAAHGNIGLSNSASLIATAGVKALSAVLDRVRITTVNGTDAFDAGSVNISYER